MEKIVGVLVTKDDIGFSANRFVLDYHNYKSMYPILNCETFGIPTRFINGKPYDIYLDDEGLLKGRPVNAASTDGVEILVGNLFFCKHDDEGHIASLSEDDVKNILSAISFDEEDNGYISYTYKGGNL